MDVMPGRNDEPGGGGGDQPGPDQPGNDQQNSPDTNPLPGAPDPAVAQQDATEPSGGNNRAIARSSSSVPLRRDRVMR